MREEFSTNLKIRPDRPRRAFAAEQCLRHMERLKDPQWPRTDKDHGLDNELHLFFNRFLQSSGTEEDNVFYHFKAQCRKVIWVSEYKEVSRTRHYHRLGPMACAKQPTPVLTKLVNFSLEQSTTLPCFNSSSVFLS